MSILDYYFLLKCNLICCVKKKKLSFYCWTTHLIHSHAPSSRPPSPFLLLQSSHTRAAPSLAPGDFRPDPTGFRARGGGFRPARRGFRAGAGAGAAAGRSRHFPSGNRGVSAGFRSRSRVASACSGFRGFPAVSSGKPLIPTGFFSLPTGSGCG